MTHMCASRMNRQNNVSCAEILVNGFRNNDLILHQSVEQYSEAIESGNFMASVTIDEAGNRVLMTPEGNTITDEEEIERWLQDNVLQDDGVLPEMDTSNDGDNHNNLYDSKLSI